MVVAINFVASAAKSEVVEAKDALKHPLGKVIAELAATLATCEGVQGAGSYTRKRAEAEKELASILPDGTPTSTAFDNTRAAVRRARAAPPSGEACQIAIYTTTEAFNSEVRKIRMAKSAAKIDLQNVRAASEVAAWVKVERARLDALPPNEKQLAQGAIAYVTTWGVCRWTIASERLMRDLVILRLSTIKGHPWAVDAINRVENEVTPLGFGGSGDQSKLGQECEDNMQSVWRKLEWVHAKAQLARGAQN